MNRQTDDVRVALQALDSATDLANTECLHVYQLRPNLRVGFILPKDLTQADASRMAEYIKSLPFPEDSV